MILCRGREGDGFLEIDVENKKKEKFYTILIIERVGIEITGDTQKSGRMAGHTTCSQ